jgi:hypothetical protein
MRIVWNNQEKLAVFDNMIKHLVTNPTLSNKQVLHQRVFTYKSRIYEARNAADKIRADSVIKPLPVLPTPEPVKKLDTLGEVFELFIDALADRIIDKMIKAKQQVEERVEPELKHDDLLDATFFGGRLMDQLKGLSIRTPAKVKRPTALVIGLNGAQMECVKLSRPEVDFTFVSAEQALSHNTLNKDHTFLMTKFINHSVQGKYRKHPNLHYVNGGVSDLKTILHGIFRKETA